MACFADINVSQGSAATYARCGGIFNTHLTANFLKNLPVKKCVNRLRFDRIMVISLWPRFLAHPVDHNQVHSKNLVKWTCSRKAMKLLRLLKFLSLAGRLFLGAITPCAKKYFRTSTLQWLGCILCAWLLSGITICWLRQLITRQRLYRRSPYRTLIGSHILRVGRHHRRAAPMTENARMSLVRTASGNRYLINCATSISFITRQLLKDDYTDFTVFTAFVFFVCRM